jgi:hypothetical protein
MSRFESPRPSQEAPVQAVRMPVVKEPVIMSSRVEARLRMAEQAGVDANVLRGLRDSLAATAPVNNEGNRIVTTQRHSFQLGLLNREIRGLDADAVPVKHPRRQP